MQRIDQTPKNLANIQSQFYLTSLSLRHANRVADKNMKKAGKYT